jgi:hypothetical protein
LGPKGYGAMPQAFSIHYLVLRPVLNHSDKNTIAHHTKAEKTCAGQASLRDVIYLVILLQTVRHVRAPHRTLQRVTTCLSTLVVYSQTIGDSTSVLFYASMHEP